jgi:hypothetical protein
MNEKKAKAIRRATEKVSEGQTAHVTRRLYREAKKHHALLFRSDPLNVMAIKIVTIVNAVMAERNRPRDRTGLVRAAFKSFSKAGERASILCRLEESSGEC